MNRNQINLMNTPTTRKEIHNMSIVYLHAICVKELSEDLAILQYTLLEASVLAPPIIPLPIFQVPTNLELVNF